MSFCGQTCQIQSDLVTIVRSGIWSGQALTVDTLPAGDSTARATDPADLRELKDIHDPLDELLPYNITDNGELQWTATQKRRKARKENIRFARDKSGIFFQHPPQRSHSRNFCCLTVVLSRGNRVDATTQVGTLKTTENG